MPTPYSVFSGTNYSVLTDALLAPNSGVNIVSGSIQLDPSGPSAVNFYDGSLTSLGIGAGLLLTSGTTPGMSNTVGWFGTDNSSSSGFSNGDADINAVVNTVFQTQSYDATTFAFDFTVSDPTATSVSFDLVFGSDEYPEWVDQFVDSAVVMVNGVNYALFNHDPMHPLSVVSSNLAAGYFIDNAGSALPIEYDGVSHLLKIVAPIHAGVNSIKIGIADTGDHIYDSGIFVANFSAGTIPGSGVVISPPTVGTDNSDTVSGTAKDEYFDLKGGDDTVYAGGGDDIVVAGSGNDVVYGGSGNDEMKGDGGDDILDGGDGSDTAVYAGASSLYSVVYDSVSGSYQVTDSSSGVTSDASDSLTNTELIKFSDGLFQLTPTGLSLVVTPGVGTVNNAGTVVITGVGSVGNTLIASVNDLDGVPASVNYQWQVQDGGIWSDIGGNSNSYTVTLADAGMQVRVIAEYVDNGLTAESPISAEKSILDVNNGDLVVTLMQLTAPLGASTMNPLTTLMQDAIDLGITSNVAGNLVKSVLGIDPSINLLHYDAWSVLQADANDAVALTVEMISVQVAILASLSDDDSGVALTLAMLDAMESGQQLDLANANDLASILGIDISGITDKNLYPQPLREIFDRNSAMADAIADGDGIAAIEQEWLDLLSIQSGIASTSIADLSVHINQSPIGSATAALLDGVAGESYVIAAADLLAGFNDPDGDALSVVDLAANTAGALQDNGDGTWTFTPDANFSGPVELTYTVVDGLGGSAPGSQLFVIPAPVVVPVNHAPTLENALADQSLACKTAFSFSIPADAFADSDVGDTLTYDASLADGSALPAWLIFDAASGTFSGTPDLANVGGLTVKVTATDTAGASVADTFLLNVVSLIEGGADNDKLTGTGVDDQIFGYDGNDNLHGYNGSDLLDGGAGNDTLYGGLGADQMYGGNGDDKYWVDNAGDEVTELAGEGIDLVSAAISYNLTSDVENLTLSGTANIDGAGNDLDNRLTGNAGSNQLIGGAGNDSLNGTLGADLMFGGVGNDNFWVDDAGDVVTEYAGEGSDRVYSAIDFSLTNDLENLTLTGMADIDATGNTLNNTLTGNAGNNQLLGGAGNDTLNGGFGADIMLGGADNDTYTVDSVADVVTEFVGEGTDTVRSSISHTLSDNVERLLLGGSDNIDATGNDLNNVLVGNAGNNLLQGGLGADTLQAGAGADVLNGGLGKDNLTGGADADQFVFNAALGSGVDTIVDFVPNLDHIVLDSTVFTAFVNTGTPDAAMLASGAGWTAAKDADDHLIYNSSNGSLYYDADGIGGAASMKIAVLMGAPNISHFDVLIA